MVLDPVKHRESMKPEVLMSKVRRVNDERFTLLAMSAIMVQNQISMALFVLSQLENSEEEELEELEEQLDEEEASDDESEEEERPKKKAKRCDENCGCNDTLTVNSIEREVLKRKLWLNMIEEKMVLCAQLSDNIGDIVEQVVDKDIDCDVEQLLTNVDVMAKEVEQVHLSISKTKRDAFMEMFPTK